MRIEKDKNNLLTIFNENIPQTKEYTYNVGGYTFSDFDKGIIILHKKEWKIISLKNLGDNMSVVYMKEKKTKTCLPVGKVEDGKFNGEALKLFQGFDEETGKKYYFIPGLGEAQQQEKNNILKKLGTPYRIEKTAKGMIVEGLDIERNTENALKYLFGLMVIYGKFDSKKGELNSIRIQIPLSGQHLAHEEIFDSMIKKLQQEGIFLKTDKLPNKNGMVYQISSNDYELLEIFAHWYEAVEKFEKISKREFTDEMKIKLIEFIETNTEIPQEGKEEVLRQIKEGTMKLLTK